MTNIYRTQGKLENPVSNIVAARDYLQETDMTQYVDAELQTAVAHIEWDLVDEESWKVTVVTHRPLTGEESAALSLWICGQNSDGLGEGFEQQPFAEQCDTDAYGNDDEESYTMASFDWQTNACELTLIK